jgi:hypothetical protein
MKNSFLLITIVVFGCHSRQLKIEDLKFGDFEKEGIAKNRVDTTFLIAKNPAVKWKYGELVYAIDGDTTDFFNWKFMDVGFVVYDSVGRLIRDESMRWRDYRYFYDSLGILDSVVYRDWDVRPKYSSTYEFYADSLVLIQNWTERGDIHHICRFKFNDKGELIEQYDDDDENNSTRREAYRSFEYDNGKMKSRNEKIFRKGKLESETKTRMYYSNYSQLDSTVAEVNSKEEGIYKMVTYYDTTGLKTQTVLMDTVTILYRHTKRVR